jgi:FtsZ-binding cell division protein ZapB
MMDEFGKQKRGFSLGETDKERRNNLIIIILSALLLIVIVVFVYQHGENQKMMDSLNKEKASIQAELGTLMTNYDSLHTNNEALQSELSNAQGKVKDLLTEVEQVKRVSYDQINQYRQEVTTMRNIMKNYIVQIDSLNRRNELLMAENAQVKENFAQSESKNQQLEKEKQHLQEKIKEAAQLEATELVAVGINARGKEAESARRAEQIRVSFVLSKNVTAPRGNKTIYVRIQKPNQVLLQQSASDLFQFEDLKIPYSAKREVTYEGNALPVNIFWDNRGQEFMAGEYTIDIFADGNNIGTTKFTMKR